MVRKDQIGCRSEKEGKEGKGKRRAIEWARSLNAQDDRTIQEDSDSGKDEWSEIQSHRSMSEVAMREEERAKWNGSCEGRSLLQGVRSSQRPQKKVVYEFLEVSFYSERNLMDVCLLLIKESLFRNPLHHDLIYLWPAHFSQILTEELMELVTTMEPFL